MGVDMPEISEAQLEANRANAMLSTGPRTEEGRQRSSMNATKHGLAGRTVLLPREDPEKYAAFVKEIVDSWQPANPKERELAQLVADQQWRLRRIRDIEMDVLENGATVQELATLATYQQRIVRVMRDAKRDLEGMQAERKREEAEKKTQATELYRFRKMMELPWEPGENGFVYSAQEMEEEVGRLALKKEVQLARNWGYDRAKYEAWKKEGWSGVRQRLGLR
jgi:hypothetical protein